MKRITGLLIVVVLLAAGIVIEAAVQKRGQIYGGQPSIFLSKAVFSSSKKPLANGIGQPQARKVNQESLENINVLATFILNSQPQVIIKEAGIARSHIYKVNDVVGGARIIYISLDKIVFVKEGKKYAFYDINKRVNLDTPLQQLSSSDFMVNKNALAQELTSINHLTRKVKIVPNIENGKVSGLKIVKLGDVDIISKAGLRQDDIIRTINGVELKSFKDAYKLLKIVRTGEIAQLDLEVENKNTFKKGTYRRTLTYTFF